MTDRIFEYISSKCISTNKLIRYAYSGDASYYRYLPSAVAFPENIEDVRALFHYCKKYNDHLTFRAAGTSLSGQAQTDGILVDISKGWRQYEVIQGGKYIKTQPGVVAGKLNSALFKYNKKIGPDPASIHSCMAGGIAANNSSGMSSGIVLNPYNTIKFLSFLLPDGTHYDSSNSNSENLLKLYSPNIYNGLLAIKNEIINNKTLKNKIIEKYKIKNTTGYSLNSFLDYEKPIDILSHLMIGSEGTLGFISEIVFETFSLHKEKLTGILFFNDLYSATKKIPFLKSMNANALEIMDYNSLFSIRDKSSFSEAIDALPIGASAILFEYEADDKDELYEIYKKIDEKKYDLKLILKPYISTDFIERENIWNIRRGLLTSLSATRVKGTCVIIEDLAFAIEDLGDALMDLQLLLNKSGFSKTGIYGHCLDGNVHFILSKSFVDSSDIDAFHSFMNDLAVLVIDKYNASLKAEHGTGRSIAPFLEKEWGKDAVEIMVKIKNLIDPDNILNPDVIISKDNRIHLKNIKQIPQVNEIIDKCIECGFCESVCPSRDYTLNPRMRIAISRILNDSSIDTATKKEIIEDYAFYSVDTCAVDGLCELKCPVGINTGEFVKFERERRVSKKDMFANLIASNPNFSETTMVAVNRIGHFGENFFNVNNINSLINLSEKCLNINIPKWNKNIPYPAKLIYKNESNPEFIYFPCCSSRIMGNEKYCLKDNDIIASFDYIAKLTNSRIIIPKDLKGSCCGMAFSSKGYKKAGLNILSKTLQKMYSWSDKGNIPIVFDSSSCLYFIKKCIEDKSLNLSEEYLKINFIDSIEYFERISHKFNVINKKQRIVLHPNCSLIKMGLLEKFNNLSMKFSDEVIIPDNYGCCGFAGDRGLIYPRLTESAAADEGKEAAKIDVDGYYSTNIPCNIGMTGASNRKYLHIAHLVKDCL